MFFYSVQQQSTISWLDCDMQQKVDCIWQLLTISSVVGPRRSFKALPKAKLAPEKSHGRDWWSSTHVIYYSFLNPSKTITSEKYAQQINEMHQKLQCLQPALVNSKGTILLRDNAWPHLTHPTLQNCDFFFWFVVNSWGIHLLSFFTFPICFKS